MTCLEASLFTGVRTHHGASNGDHWVKVTTTVRFADQIILDLDLESIYKPVLEEELLERGGY